MKTNNQTADMSEITVVEFENAVHTEETYLSELSDGPPYTVHGVALGAGDVTKGKSGIKKKWPAEELRKAAETLQGTNLVVDHENSAHGVVGRVTKAGYKDDRGVVYEAELYDEDLAEKIKDGLLEVSVRGLHEDVDNLEEDSETEALVVEGIEFKNLSVVPSGAAPSNTLQMGEHAELSAAELSAFTDELEPAELQEIEPGMWVKWGDQRGVTISQVQDGEIEVDIYEQDDDDQWRSTEETTMVSTDDLSEWDVDEENIGPAEDSDEEDDESDEEENADPDEEEAETDEDSEKEETDDAPDPPEFKEGDMVQWQVAPSMKGEIVHAPNNQDIVMVEVMQEQDGELTETGFTVTAGYSDLVKMDESGGADGADEDVESDDGDTPSEEENASDDADELSADSGATVNDLINVLSTVVENASTSEDVPTEDAEPDHEPMGSVENLFNQFMEDGGSPDSTLADFIDWLNQQDELGQEPEGADDILDSPVAIRRMKENDAAYMAFVWQDEDSDELAEEELQDYEMHTPDWSGTTTADWSSPDMKDFDTDDLSEIASHFLISATGFPPENFSDLKLPVVEPNGDLNLNALAAVKGGRGVSAVDGLSSDMEQEIVDWVNETANDEFDKTWGQDEEENGEAEMADVNVPADHRFESKEDAEAFVEDMDGLTGVHQMEFDGETMWVPGDTHEEYVDVVAESSKHGDDEEDEEEMTETTDVQSEPTQTKTVGGVRVLPGDDLRDELSGESETDSMTQYKVTIMNDEIEEKLSELNDPVAVEAEELQSLQDKADRFEEMSENLEAIKERTDILDEVDRAAVEELRDGDDPIVVESARHEELQSEAEQVKGVYAAQLSEHYDAFDSDELADKFSIEELREKYESQFGSIEELADSTEAEPQSQDPSEEELEEESGEGGSEEELADEVAEKQAQIRNKLNLGGD